MSPARRTRLEALSRRRFRVASVLTATMLTVYFGFLLLVAFDKPLMGRLASQGLSIGMLLGAGVIVTAWLLTGLYVVWANSRYDAELDSLR